MKKLGSENLIDLNEAMTFVLCQEKPQLEHARRQYRFMVVRLKDNAIMHEGTFSMGCVKWRDNASIELYSGGIQEDNSTKKIIRVNSPPE